MKSLALVFILIFAGIIFFTRFSYSACDYPINYKIGFVDTRFNLSKDEFISDTKDASDIWNTVEKKNLFTFDPQGNLTINLVFDERQQLNNQINQIEGNIKQGKNSLDPAIAEYQKLVSDFKKRVASFNEAVSYWNSKGGAPASEYEKLVKEQEDIKKQSDKLNQMAKSLNQSTQEYNSEIGKLNQTVDSFNQTLSLKPEEGVYKSQDNVIDIYFNVNHQELVHTLAHELGHAIGLNHIQDPHSIMYPFTTQEITPSIDDISALKYICRKQNIVEAISTKAPLLIYSIVSKIQVKQ